MGLSTEEPPPKRLRANEGKADPTPGVKARANFVRNDVPFGCTKATEAEAGSRQGFEVSADLMDTVEIELEPLPADARLEVHGVELLDVRAALEAAGVREDNVDPANKEHRIAVGKVLIEAAEKRFGGGKRAIHMADTSRVSGASVYGEATVRNTAAGSKLRAAHLAVHMDKFLPGVAKFWNHAGARAGAQDFVDTYWEHWKSDFGALGVGKEDAVNCVEGAAPGLVNLWVSLTPGEIKQTPLVVADRRTLDLGPEDLDKVSTVAVTFPTLKDTLTLVRSKVAASTRWLWRPKMRFGEVLLFSTPYTPHSAVHLVDGPEDAPRQSAEIRVFIVDPK